MSEADYQRGLRGGDCPVSISEFERWRDWKAGRDAYESAQEEEAEARMAEFETPAEKLARIDARMRASDDALAKLDRLEREHRREAQERKQRDDSTVMFAVPTACLSVGFVVGIVAGYILKWIFNIPVAATLVATLVIAALWAWGAVNAILKD